MERKSTKITDAYLRKLTGAPPAARQTKGMQRDSSNCGAAKGNLLALARQESMGT